MLDSHSQIVECRLSRKQSFCYITPIYISSLGQPLVNSSSSLVETLDFNKSPKQPHYIRSIKPQTLYEISDDFCSEPKLHKWAIDQLHAKIIYGYTGYDDQKEDNPDSSTRRCQGTRRLLRVRRKAGRRPRSRRRRAAIYKNSKGTGYESA